MYKVFVITTYSHSISNGTSVALRTDVMEFNDRTDAEIAFMNLDSVSTPYGSKVTAIKLF